MQRWWLLWVGLVLWGGVGGEGYAREGIPVQLSWEYAISLSTNMIVDHIQVQRCSINDCTTTCTPNDLSDATAGMGQSWGTAVTTGTWAADLTLKTATFTATTGRYVKLVATSEINGNPWTSVGEVNIYANSSLIPQAQLSIVSVDSQELEGENGAAWNVLDGSGVTFWHTFWFSASPAPPHQIIIDLGQSYAVNRLDYLPRQDGGVNGTIAGYAIYISSTLTTALTDSTVTAGTSYRYQAVAVGQVNGVPSRSDPSAQVCTYVKALHRGRPSVIEE